MSLTHYFTPLLCYQYRIENIILSKSITSNLPVPLPFSRLTAVRSENVSLHGLSGIFVLG